MSTLNRTNLTNIKNNFQNKTGAELHSQGTHRSFRTTAVMAAAIACCLTVTAFAANYFADGAIIQALTGQRVEYGHTIDDEGNELYTITFDASNIVEPAETRDGRIYFTLDGSDTDITDYCAEDAYYSYEHTADDGNRHVILVGGTPDDISWAEFIWDENGTSVGGAGLHYNNFIKPTWAELAYEAYGLEH